MAAGSHSHYDICVVGAGLIGSAAARHLVENNPRLRVALIGPQEPKDRSKTDIFGAWFDQGRITRIIDPDPIWAALGERSINRYRDLERKSGINFYEPVGYLGVGPSDGSQVVELKQCAKDFNQQVEELQYPDLRQKFSYLNCPSHHVGVYTRQNSGYLSPREMVYAQQEVCRQRGCDLIQQIVDLIHVDIDKGWTLKLHSGQCITSQKVLVAVGAFSGFRSLLPGNVLPDMDLYGTTTLLVEVEAEDLPQYAGMPSLLTEDIADHKEAEKSQNEGCHVLPPIKYPDGKYYLKIGTGWSHTVKLNTPAQTREWFIRGSNPSSEQWLLKKAKRLFPGLKYNNYKFDCCVVTYTATGHLYVDMVAPDFGVALGGCGYAAKSSDEIGYMAARMIVSGKWDYDLPAHHFRFRPKPNSSNM